MNQHSVLLTICARGGSKGVPNKNIRPLLGKPLIAYTIEQAISSGVAEHVVVSTDSDEISEVSITYGAEVFFKRPAELAGDTAPKVPVIRHALNASEEHYGQHFDFLIDLDATAPLRTADDIRSAFDELLEHGYDNLITAAPARRSPYFNLVELDERGRVKLSKTADQPIFRRQDAPACFDMNASIYIWKRDVLMANDSVFLENTGLHVMPPERSIDIDSELDFRFVEHIMKGSLKDR